MEYLTGFVTFIMDFIGYIQDLITYIRAKNDGKENVEPPTPPEFKLTAD